MIRKPAVAGAFYPSSPKEIENMLRSMVDDNIEKVPAIGVLSPHAGWVYSGKGAGIVFSSVIIPDNVIILCPNHRGAGYDVAVMSEGIWQMPTGDVHINSELAALLKSQSDLFTDDPRAHASEHSLEVQIPFIQHFRPDFKLVPVSLGRVSLEECRELGRATATALKAYPGETLIVASSDMTHFESSDSAKKKDHMALEKILALDPEGLYETVMKNRISMCGVLPVVTALLAAKALGARNCTLVRYAHSGLVNGDNSRVVGYAGFTVQ